MIPFPVISAWDPRATTAGSIDPLGALRAYNAIASFLLPGVTTITTRVRYLSWLCAGLRLLDDVRDAPAGGTAARSRRQRLLAWERLLVLATGYHTMEYSLASDDPAWRGLRGISYMRKAIEQGKTGPDFELLRNQAGVGAVGTYWVTLVQGGLVEDMSAELTERGRALADAFLKGTTEQDRRAFALVLGKGKQKFDRSVLGNWGKRMSLQVPVRPLAEAACLRDALLQPQTQRLLARTRATIKDPGSNRDTFKRLIKVLRKEREPLAEQMAAVMQVTCAFEQLHACLLQRFDQLRRHDLQGRPVPLSQVAGSLKAYWSAEGDKVLKQAGHELDRCLQSLPALSPSVAGPLRQFLQNLRPVLEATSASEFVRCLCHHHERVQSGKLDASSQPKQAWVALQGNDLVIAPRFALKDAQVKRDINAFTHPYRIESFVGLLSEVDHAGKQA